MDATAPTSELFGLTFAEFSARLRLVVGHERRFHRALYRQLMATGRCDPAMEPVWQEAERSAPGVIARLMPHLAVVGLPTVVTQRQAHDEGIGTTRKLVIRLHDGREVESVLIPMGGGPEDGGHATVCVSSQVGCKMGCRFCHTATMGLVRNLSAAEIVAQVLLAGQVGGVKPRNVVFMGMGEPLDNLDAVAKAVHVLTDVNGIGLALRHVTISTVGRVDQLPRLVELGLGRVNLAVSLTAADDALRSELMPVNRMFDLGALKAALLAHPLPGNRRVLISYVLMAGVNDADHQIDALAAWTSGLRVLINLIPFNPIPSRPEQPSSPERIIAIRARLEAAGVEARLRRTKGDGVMAACGQLGDPAQRRMPRTQPVTG
jgi:23S rRNA (adenine2503-C2)-methyltransferase